MMRKKGISSDNPLPQRQRNLSTEEVLLMRQEKQFRKKQISAKRFILFLTAVLLVFCFGFFAPFTMTVRAEQPTDEIEHFEITVDVQEDATLQMTYHIDWKVLDDKKYGPLEWVNIGMPNANHSEVTALGDSIDHISDNGSTLAVYLDRSYYKDEVASFEFSFVQDHMYQIDRFVEGETVFAYTPAWFDEIEVKDLTIRWNEDKAGAWQPDCLMDNGYLVFSANLEPGERYSITVAYPNDAFGFSPDRQAGGSQDDDWDEDWDDDANDYSGSYYEEEDDTFALIVGFIAFILFLLMPIISIYRFFVWIANGFGFGSDSSRPEYQKKITRTKIEYYEFCPSCGAGREEGKDNCAYCGHSIIKSKHVVEEKDL